VTSNEQHADLGAKIMNRDYSAKNERSKIGLRFLDPFDSTFHTQR
jgi:hypothetical protein